MRIGVATERWNQYVADADAEHLGYIRWRFRLPGKVGMIPLVRIIGVTIWSIC